jgi:hypothetical protein
MAGVTGDWHNLKVYGDRDPPKAESTFFGEGSIPCSPDARDFVGMRAARMGAGGLRTAGL